MRPFVYLRADDAAAVANAFAASGRARAEQKDGTGRLFSVLSPITEESPRSGARARLLTYTEVVSQVTPGSA